MLRIIPIALLSLLISACSVGKVSPLEKTTGYFPAQSKATVITSKPVDLDSKKALILIPNNEFFKGQIANIKYFDQAMTLDDLEKAIIQNNLSEKIPTISEKIGLNNAAKHYKPFLYLYGETRRDNDHSYHGRYVLVDAVTMDELFVTETELDYAWKGVNDQYNWYPMFNALIDYIKSNSKTYQLQIQPTAINKTEK